MVRLAAAAVAADRAASFPLMLILAMGHPTAMPSPECPDCTLPAGACRWHAVSQEFIRQTHVNAHANSNAGQMQHLQASRPAQKKLISRDSLWAGPAVVIGTMFVCQISGSFAFQRMMSMGCKAPTWIIFPIQGMRPGVHILPGCLTMFLGPCKTGHQIFVGASWLMSSLAPELNHTWAD